MDRLMKETTSIIAQLGTMLKKYRTYPMGTASPRVARGPSNGWKYPSW